MKERHVVCVQQRLTHYRERLFDDLRHALALRRITFDLVHGQPDGLARKKQDAGALAWAHTIENSYITLGGHTAVWQSIPQPLTSADLIILTQENKLLANYGWLIRRRIQPTRVAYWGHGRNFQAESANSLRERWKKLLIGQVDWWFAYTEMTRDILFKDGYPKERISVLDNAIDNEGFQTDLSNCNTSELAVLRSALGMAPAAPVGLFCGSLYADKKLDYLVAAADCIRKAKPDFHLIVIGDGPDANIIQDAARHRPWLHAVGVRKGREKARYFRLANVVLNPGLVGLHVLDSFCAGLPMVTTAEARHSPEIAYLQHDRNGLIISGNHDLYAAAVVDLLRQPERHAALRSQALSDASRYTLANMTNCFAEGIERCLSLPKKS